ncbi:hypothetical protein GN958_ATG15802 [Phytophthora infestans]|uniref:Secreted RxLR effector peptide protein n=1 Tax=Phytophthora infestans TaxID=4787 RepID=A0A8S9U6Y3_PHYIN|nr:hypothetical protein GN958_ATG15802 [Phytophthora infestans]
MAAKSLNKHFSYFILLLALVLLGCVSIRSVSTTVPNSNAVPNEGLVGDVGPEADRRLRMQTWSAKDEGYSSSEERVSGVEKFRDFIKSRATALKNFAKNLNRQKATEDSVTELGGKAVESKRIDAALTQSVTNTRPELSEEAFLSTLTAQYGDEALTKLLEQAQRPGSSRLATMVKDVQLDHWVSQEKTADDIYNRLKLSVEDADFLEKPLLGTWIAFVEDKLKEDPYDFLLLKLAKHYEGDTLAKMLHAASTSDRTSAIAKNLEKAQLRSTRNTEDDVLKLLHLNVDEGLKFLKQPDLRTFISIVTSYRKTDPYEFLALKLTQIHGEAILANMLVKAKSDPRLRIYAEKIEAAQIKNWLATGKTEDDVLKILHLNPDEGLEFLKQPALQTFISYATKHDTVDLSEYLVLK